MSTYKATTHDITVEVSSTYQPSASKPHQNIYVHSYHVKISNAGAHSVQLLTRHWYISDATGTVREVHGEGVIGKQPIIEPGARHEYMSWSPIPTTIGKMWGTYGMVRVADGASFDIEVPAFQLIAEFKLN